MSKKPRNEKVIATLELIVQYEEVPDTSSLQEVIEKASELGSVVKAELTIHRSTKVNLI